MSQAGTVNGGPHLIDKDMARESVNKMKDGNTAEPSGVVS